MGLSLKLSINIPEKANRTTIDGKTYATDINGKGLYCLVSDKEDENEGYFIYETFKILKNYSGFYFFNKLNKLFMVIL